MKPTRAHIIYRWALLLLIGFSVSFSTLHSHHHLEWNHSDSHIDTGNCLVEDSNLCPIDGYLLSALTVSDPGDTNPLTLAAILPTFIEYVHGALPVYSPTGRSPPQV